MISVAALALFATYEVVFGRLAPFSPVVVGFSRHDCGKAVVCHYQQQEAFQLSYLNGLVAAEEKYHGMQFRWKPEVLFCRTEGQYRRLTGSRARFIAINGRVFVSPRAQADAREGTIDLRTYLAHEMSHCLLQQQMSILRNLRTPRWLLEGTAMDFAGQVGVGIYPTKSMVYDTVAGGVFCEPEDFGTCFGGETGTAVSCPLENKIAFFYSEFGCIVEFLRSSYGAEKYQAFLKEVVASPEFDVESSFEKVYQTSFREEIARFKTAAKTIGK